MRKIMTGLIVLCFSITILLPGAAMANTFTDTSGHWASSYIDRLADSGHISGYPDKSYRPENTMSRAEFILILINSLGATVTDTTTKNFSDTGDHWARGMINEAVRLGILLPAEYPDGLKPDQPIKRSEAAAALIRALGKPPLDSVSTFKDAASIDRSMYKGYIKAAVNEGLVNGYDDNTFRPFNNITRAQAAVLFCRFLDKKSGTTVTPVTPQTPGSGITINPATDNLETVRINNVSYPVGTAPVSFKTESGTVKATTISKYSGGILLNYSTRLSLTASGLEIIVNNVRYGVSQMSVSGKELNVTTSYCKLSSFEVNGSNYNSEYTDLYLDESISGYLSDLEIIDEYQVKKGGTTYELDDENVAIEVEDEFYAIVGLTIDSDGIELDLEEIAPLRLKRLSISDIDRIRDGSNDLDLDDIDEISFIVNNKNYSLAECTVETSGDLSIDDDSYSPSQVVMVIDDVFYDLEELEINRDGKIEIYCDSSDREFVRIDDLYVDKDDLTFIYDDEEYEVDDVLVIKRNTVRINKKEYNVRNIDLECEYDGDTYDVEEIDWDEDMDIMTIETEEGVDDDDEDEDEDQIEPEEYVFYLDGSEYEGDVDEVEIKVGSTWRGFDRIEILSETRYTYSGSTYNFSGAQIRIDGEEFEVDDTTWSSGTEVFKVYLAEENDDTIEPEEYIFYLDGSKYEDDIDNVEIKVGSTWRYFDRIELIDETRYRYGGSTYDLTGAQLRIDGDYFEVDDAAWSSSSEVFRVFMIED